MRNLLIVLKTVGNHRMALHRVGGRGDVTLQSCSRKLWVENTSETEQLPEKEDIFASK